MARTMKIKMFTTKTGKIKIKNIINVSRNRCRKPKIVHKLCEWYREKEILMT